MNRSTHLQGVLVILVGYVEPGSWLLLKWCVHPQLLNSCRKHSPSETYKFLHISLFSEKGGTPIIVVNVSAATSQNVEL